MANTRRRHYRSYLLHLLPLACSAQKKICWAALATASRHDVPIGGPDSLDAGFGRKVPDSPALPAAQPSCLPPTVLRPYSRKRPPCVLLFTGPHQFVMPRRGLRRPGENSLRSSAPWQSLDCTARGSKTSPSEVTHEINGISAVSHQTQALAAATPPAHACSAMLVLVHATADLNNRRAGDISTARSTQPATHCGFWISCLAPAVYSWIAGPGISRSPNGTQLRQWRRTGASRPRCQAFSLVPVAASL